VIGRYSHQQTTPGGRVIRHDYSGAVPMLSTARHTAYRLQNCGGGLTIPQERQVRKSAKRAMWGAR
jgi:hypothetical protein